MASRACSICLTKLDILDDFDEVKIAVAYKMDGAPVEGMPGTATICTACSATEHLFPPSPPTHS